MLATYGLNMFARLIGNSKLAVGVNVSVNGCLSLSVIPARGWVRSSC